MAMPIDPDDGDALLLVQKTARVRAIEDPNVPTLLINRVVLCTVARAVLPEGYVAVPAAKLKEIDDELSEYAVRFADLKDDNDYYRGGNRFDGGDALTLRYAARLIRSLLPESEATR